MFWQDSAVIQFRDVEHSGISSAYGISNHQFPPIPIDYEIPSYMHIHINHPMHTFNSGTEFRNCMEFLTIPTDSYRFGITSYMHCPHQSEGVKEP